MAKVKSLWSTKKN